VTVNDSLFSSLSSHDEDDDIINNDDDDDDDGEIIVRISPSLDSFELMSSLAC
jgi:hypothetical protein